MTIINQDKINHSKTRYVLFNSQSHAIRLGKDNDYDKLRDEAEGLHLVSGDNYRIWDIELQANVYHWPQQDEPECRVCGCTSDNACPGGCHWVEQDLCSQCVDKGPAIGEVG